MKIVLITYSIFFFTGLAIKTHAQDYKTDFAKIKAAYSNDKSISVDVFYKYFSSAEEKKADDTLKGHLIMYRNNYICHISDVDILKNDRCFLTIDNTNKKIIIGKSPHTMPAFSFDVFDSLIQQKDISIIYVALQSGDGAYIITKTNGDPYKYKIVFDKQSYMVSEFDIYYHHAAAADSQSINTQPELCVYYTHNKQSTPDLSVFSETKYITAQNKTLVPVAAYRSYKIIDNLTHN